MPDEVNSRREQGAKLLHDLCNAVNPQERDRLAKELDAHLIDPLVQQLTEWENTPKGSSERLQAFKKVIETLYNEHA